ncbi:MAG: TetR/AcrR family transcriptional regulator [Rhodomicrobium sp.]|nr:TetR/AcrR family transcriptional regulator [Rhodomicrobium sp.]
MAERKRRTKAKTVRRYHHGNLRKTLLDAAEAELAEKGIEGFSLRAIAKRAGVSHAAPAHHFRDVKGLLTALAADGFSRFLATQKARQSLAGGNSHNQLVAAGLGYIEFALTHPALFRLMFSSDRPDFGDPALGKAAGEAFGALAEDVKRVTGADPYRSPTGMLDVMAAWSIAHGLADLMNSGRLRALLELPETQKDDALKSIIGRVVGA